MKWMYSESQLKDDCIENIDVYMKSPKFQALIVEQKVARDAGSEFVDAIGHDEVHKTKGEIETKYTNYILKGGYLRIGKIGENKRDKFKLMRIVDGINKRIFEIPHDVWYSEAKIFKSNEFTWSSSYNENDGVARQNTNLLLKYEVTE
jgi:hypothetical protein|tara:strand:- start:242 stop:685 length:444 start_codon:yes stop_codon:yes gene_type:complete